MILSLTYSGFELWQSGEDFVTDELVYKAADFSTTDEFSQKFREDEDRIRERSPIAEDRYRKPDHNRSSYRNHGYDDYSYRSHRRRDHYNDRYNDYPYRNRRGRRHRNYNENSHYNRYEDNTRFQSDDFEPPISNEAGMTAPPPRW